MVRALLRKHWIGCWNASRAADQKAESTSIGPFNGTRVIASSPSRQPKKRNIHRPVSGARGFVPRRLSYAYRRPKLFTVGDRPVPSWVSEIADAHSVSAADQTQSFTTAPYKVWVCRKRPIIPVQADHQHRAPSSVVSNLSRTPELCETAWRAQPDEDGQYAYATALR